MGLVLQLLLVKTGDLFFVEHVRLYATCRKPQQPKKNCFPGGCPLYMLHGGWPEPPESGGRLEVNAAGSLGLDVIV
jgi:hypothetical protein